MCGWCCSASYNFCFSIYSSHSIPLPSPPVNPRGQYLVGSGARGGDLIHSNKSYEQSLWYSGQEDIHRMQSAIVLLFIFLRFSVFLLSSSDSARIHRFVKGRCEKNDSKSVAFQLSVALVVGPSLRPNPPKYLIYYLCCDKLTHKKRFWRSFSSDAPRPRPLDITYCMEM